jgi:hypothetical protein
MLGPMGGWAAEVGLAYQRYVPTWLATALTGGIPAVLTAIVTLLLGAVVGGRITNRWELVKKRREIDLAAVQVPKTLSALVTAGSIITARSCPDQLSARIGSLTMTGR